MRTEYFPSPAEFFQHHSIKGFLAEIEGNTLFQAALRAAGIGPCLEIGSYCGKSTVYLGLACQQTGNTLYAVDHHRGSEEHQMGEEYHDIDLFDASVNKMDSFPRFRHTLNLALLNETVVPVVASSAVTVRHWKTPLGMVFIDGGHSDEMAINDCLRWSEKIAVGGLIAIHDIFEKPENGGQGPYLGMQAVLNRGGFELIDRVESLAILKRRDNLVEE
ncbi:class I SAM-dependent methyltransferase [Teredinibacter haidensis]|uniref:class I SAM-dependent methyltransferase n=1 Tax=Teredinibacter haidensis TaxID=2731755 RepID=UPI00094914A2|nr:class I SAM-dependent methyltransferase [Teredinibacter haidensis]